MSPRALPDSARRGWCPGLNRPMPTGDGLLARIHPPLGVLDLAQARAVAEGARRYGNGHLDLTARANLQIRGVTEATTAPLAALLDAAGLGDTRRDGGPQRLTLTSPLAGRDPFDIPVLARAIEEAGRGVAALPAKTLVAVGFAMEEADFSVLPLEADRVAILAGASGWECGLNDAPSAIGTLLAAFAATGKRRMRDVSTRDWPPLLPPPFAEEGGPRRGAGEGPRDGSGCDTFGTVAPLSPPAAQGTLPRRGGREAHVPSPGLSNHGGQPVLALDAPFGRCTVEAFEGLIAVAEDIGAPEFRLSPSRGIVLLPSHPERVHLADLASDFIVATDDPRRAVAACTGAPACASGSTPTLTDAVRIAAIFRPLAARGLSAHVSGCAKGCAKPGPADLTLVGHEGEYGIVVGGAPGEPQQLQVPIEAAIERLGRAATLGLAAAFASATNDGGRNRRPA